MRMSIAMQENEYHVERARQELDLGYRADGGKAASAHLKLAALHMKQAFFRADAVTDGGIATAADPKDGNG